MGLARRVVFRAAAGGGAERLARVVPLLERAVWPAAGRYVAGRTRREALIAALGLLADSRGVSLDYVGEHVADPGEADRVTAEYVALAADLHRTAQHGDAWLSVDLTHLALDTDPRRTTDRLEAIVSALPRGARLQVGAEEAARTGAVLTCLLTVASRVGATRLGATLQANLLRSRADLRRLVEAGIHVRLVKGAYLERTDALPHGPATDEAYRHLAHLLAAAGAPWSAATHDTRLRDALLAELGPVTVEQLFGVHPQELDALQARGVPIRVYVPYGPAWLTYWLRRVAEAQGA